MMKQFYDVWYTNDLLQPAHYTFIPVNTQQHAVCWLYIIIVVIIVVINIDRML